MSKRRKSFWNFRAMQNLWSNELFSTIMRYLELVISYLKRNPLLLRNGMKSLKLLPLLLAEWWTYRKTAQRWVCNFERTGMRVSSGSFLPTRCDWLKTFAVEVSCSGCESTSWCISKRIAFKDPQSTFVCIYFICWRCRLTSWKVSPIIQPSISGDGGRAGWADKK